MEKQTISEKKTVETKRACWKISETRKVNKGRKIEKQSRRPDDTCCEKIHSSQMRKIVSRVKLFPYGNSRVQLAQLQDLFF